MNMLLLNLLLALTYCLMFGGFDSYTLTTGFLVAGVLLLAVTAAGPGKTYGERLVKLLRFGGYFGRILLQANWQVAREVLTPGSRLSPRIVRYDVTGLSDLQVTTLANAITLTPGTLVLDLERDRAGGVDDARMLYVHCMFAADRDAAIADLDELRGRLLAGVFE